MDTLKTAIDTFFSFPAYVMLPIIIFVIALIVRMELKEAFIAMIRLAAGFAGVFIAFDFFVAQIAPAVERLMLIRGIDFPILDVGWPPLAAITWSNIIAPLSIPLVIGLNMLLLALGLTRTLYIDIWNFWHFAMLGVLVNVVTGSFALEFWPPFLWRFIRSSWLSGPLMTWSGRWEYRVFRPHLSL